MKPCNTALLALTLPVPDITGQSSGSLLKAELDCSDRIFFILSKFPSELVSPCCFLVSGSLAPALPSGCMNQFAVLWLLFSNYLPIFSLVIFICNCMLGIFCFTKLWLALIHLRIKHFSHIFLVLSLNMARKNLIAVCTYPGHLEFPATSFSMHKILLNLFAVTHLQLLHPQNDNWMLISNCSFTGTVRAVVSTSSLKQWVVNLAHDIYYIFLWSVKCVCLRALQTVCPDLSEAGECQPGTTTK